MLACGEGSYGRLGQGNSDDLHFLTAISALQGCAILILRILFGSLKSSDQLILTAFYIRKLQQMEYARSGDSSINYYRKFLWLALFLRDIIQTAVA